MSAYTRKPSAGVCGFVVLLFFLGVAGCSAANPVCSPTRYSLMTGKYPTRVDATNFFSGKRSGTFDPAPLNDNMPLDEITIAQALKAHGYATFFAGKWHLGESEAYYPQNRGFDINIGGYHRGGPYTGKKYFAPFENPEIKEESPAGDHLPDRLARETAQFIDDHKDTPFFAYLSFYSVHTPLMGRPDLVKKYKAKAAAINGQEFAEEEQVFGDKPRKVRILQKHAVYAAMVEAMDEAVGKVLKQLDKSGLDENTLVIFTSDNGPWLEFFAGLLLVTTFWRKEAYLIIAALLIVFTCAKTWTYAQGIDIRGCGCSGGLAVLDYIYDTPQGILTNVVLLALLWADRRVQRLKQRLTEDPRVAGPPIRVDASDNQRA